MSPFYDFINSQVFALFLPVFVIGLLFIGLSYYVQANFFRRKQMMWKVYEIIEKELDSLCSNLSETTGNVFRSAVFLKSNPESDKIEIAFCSKNMRGAPDVTIKFHRGQGCVGYCWDTERIQVADLSTKAARESVRHGMEQYQKDVTSNLRSIVTIPIYGRYNRRSRLIGILSVDSKARVVNLFRRRGVSNNLRTVSGSIGALMGRWNIVFPLD